MADQPKSKFNSFEKPVEFERLESAIEQEAIEASKKSLEAFLARVVVDSRPHPRMWSQIIEPWQVEIARKLIPPMEQMAGLRSDYVGPRWFWLGLPKGHDKTGLIGRIAAWATGFSKHTIRGVACATDRDQASLLRKSVEEELSHTPWLQRRVEVVSGGFRGFSGVVDIVAADAPGLSGEKLDLMICDEITFWKNRAVFDMLIAGTVKRPSSVFVVITNAGLKSSWQWDLRTQVMSDPEHWWFYESPPGKQLATWINQDDIKAARRTMPASMGRRVYDNIWVDEADDPLLELMWIEACQTEDTLWGRITTRFHYKPELYVGVDIGRTRDLTVIYVLEHLDDVVYTRHIEVLEDTKLSAQRDLIASWLKAWGPLVVKCNIDRGGIGYQLAEDLEEMFPRTVEGVSLGQARQGQFAVRVKELFQDTKIRIPEDEVLALDLQQISDISVTPGGAPTIATARTDIGHADRFWALALACAGLPVKQEKAYISRGPMTIKSKFSGRY